jgi:hypothetical protein
MKNLILNFLKLILVLSTLNDELFLLGLKVWVLLLDDNTEELITETLEGNHHVKESNLS